MNDVVSKLAKIAAKGAAIAAGTIGLIAGAAGQSATPTPTPAAERFEVTSSIEAGARGIDVDGSSNKYRSDLNYRAGFRVFDSSFYIEDKSTNRGMKLFDSLLFTSSGWTSDPSSSIRLRMDKKGEYSLDSNIRTVRYFNSLSNFVLNEHTADFRQNFGDVDLTIFPEREKFRARIGYSFNTSSGDGGFTTRAYSDEFPVASRVDSHSNDLRAGVDGQLLGFNLSLNYGYRRFNDNTSYSLQAPSLGNNPTNNAQLFTFLRNYPTKGETNYATFSAQRTFAKKLDFTTRWIYSTTTTKFSLSEAQTGRDNSNNQVTLDSFTANGDSKRPQTRGDVGVTWMATEKFRISDTFTFDQFHISGGNLFAEALFSKTAAGVDRATTFTNTLAYRVTSYRRFSNLVEGDYQFNDRVGFNVGWRYGHREVELTGFDRNFASANPTTFLEDQNNSTNSVIGGMRIKPVKAWTIYWDVEHGKADNVFTRLANYDFTNFRVRSRTNYKKLGLSLSAIIKNNDNPGRSEDSTVAFDAITKSRNFSGSVDYTPINELTLSGGYTYLHQDSQADILIPISGVSTKGLSQYFIRDSYFYFDVTARPIKRVSLYASYRIDDDPGQGDRVSTAPQFIISSYPMRYQTPEVRLAVRLTNHIDWNVGYQYYDYKDVQVPLQNYRAHLPYTSLRIYWGAKKGDRF